LTSVQNFTAIVPGEPLRRGVKHHRGSKIERPVDLSKAIILWTVRQGNGVLQLCRWKFLHKETLIIADFI